MERKEIDELLRLLDKNPEELTLQEAKLLVNNWPKLVGQRDWILANVEGIGERVASFRLCDDDCPSVLYPVLQKLRGEEMLVGMRD